MNTEGLTKDRGNRLEPPNYRDFGFCGVVAHAKLKPVNPTFRFFSFQATDDGSSVLTGSTTRTVTRGKRKGSLTPTGPKLIVVVTRAEEDAAATDYELATGKCSKCLGSGREWAAWNHVTGVWYRNCKSCNGTGDANVKG